MSLIYDGLALAQEQDKSRHGAGMYVLYEPFPKEQPWGEVKRDKDEKRGSGV